MHTCTNRFLGCRNEGTTAVKNSFFAIAGNIHCIPVFIIHARLVCFTYCYPGEVSFENELLVMLCSCTDQLKQPSYRVNQLMLGTMNL